MNGRAAGAVRATVHSIFARADYAGGIACGLALAMISDLFLGLAASAALLAATALTTVRVAR